MSINAKSFHIPGQGVRDLPAAEPSASLGSGVPELPASRALPASARLPLPDASQSASAPPPLELLAAPARPLRGLLHPHLVSTLDTAADFEQRAGRPKDDIRFGFLGTYRMSTGYKAILSGLTEYHATLQKDLPSKEGTVDFYACTKRFEEAKFRLTALRDAVEHYALRDPHSRKEPIATLGLQIQRELAALETLSGEIARAPNLPRMRNAKADTLLGFARQGVRLADMQTCIDQNLSPELARQHLEDVRRAGIPHDVHLAAYRRHDIGEHEAALLERAGLGPEIGQLYKEKRIPITERTLVKPHLRAGQQVGTATLLGSGNFNTTAIVEFDTAQGLQKRVVKPVPVKETGWVASWSGIPSLNPQVAIRNLCTLDAGRALGFDVIVDTELAIATRPPPPPDAAPELSLAMAPAKGSPARECPPDVFRNKCVVQKMLQLQMLDHLCAQGDRHRRNYFIDVGSDPNEVAVTGIDNDQCWGALLDHPAMIAFNPYFHVQSGFRGTRLPPVLDTATADAVVALTQQNLRQLLTGKLQLPEIDAAIRRLVHLHEHVGALRRLGRVVSLDQLVAPQFHDLFNSGNSYIGRELQRPFEYPRPVPQPAGV